VDSVRKCAVAAVAAVVCSGCARGTGHSPAPLAGTPVLTEQTSGTRSLLQAVSAVNANVLWVSGHRATWRRSIDGGATWTGGAMSGPDSTLQFRDVHAVSADVAYLLAAGPGTASRIYKTSDAGAHWQLQFTNRDSSAFYDCFDFWDASHGIAVSDAVRGRLVVIGTDDGGAHWTDRSGGLPPAADGEGGFAASGTCLIAGWGGIAYIGTGSTSGSHVYRTDSRGQHWQVATVPVVSGQASGIASLAFRDLNHGLALGGRISDANDRSDNVALTADGGRTWSQGGKPTFSGAIYGAAYAGGGTVVAVAPKGLDISDDDGMTWRNLNGHDYWAVGFGANGVGWAVGPGGRITKLAWTR
jgi:photosystem II stability/assembly factor-like uncharacterized protein